MLFSLWDLFKVLLIFLTFYVFLGTVGLLNNYGKRLDAIETCIRVPPECTLDTRAE